MPEKDSFDFANNWHKMWINHSKEFLETANKNLQAFFAENSLNPENHMQIINAWLDGLKQQWEQIYLPPEQKILHTYWHFMRKISNEATELMVSEWIKRSQQEDPIKSIYELHELWLRCCYDVYERSLKLGANNPYKDFLKTAVKLWPVT